MKQFKIKEFIWVTLIISILFGAILFYIYRLPLVLSWSMIKVLPTVVTLDLFFWAVFFKYLWKFRVFYGWLVPFPNIQGTWRGTIKSNWIDPKTNKNSPSIDTCLVIKQTFSTLSCVIYTAESESRSFTAEFNYDEDSGKRELVYSYRNIPRAAVRHRSELHFGSTILHIIGNPPKKLVGEYWTSRGTAGEIDVDFSFRNKVSSFSEVFPASQSLTVTS